MYIHQKAHLNLTWGGTYPKLGTRQKAAKLLLLSVPPFPLYMVGLELPHFAARLTVATPVLAVCLNTLSFDLAVSSPDRQLRPLQQLDVTGLVGLIEEHKVTG